MSETDEIITVEVVQALPGQTDRMGLQIPIGTTLAEALALPGVRSRFPEASDSTAGVFGKRCAPSLRLRDGDRIELYRPLIADPKAARRERAGAAKAKE
ncbi:RnfH family protein [Xanthomonadaceae bacterium JHOS43]|nr:RnfH family protein [Xanthomonadaceae bacterium JHOS43]MCX7564211.1 RnfH family protein [Xanthomonadaceae bacterium XH05]